MTDTRPTTTRRRLLLAGATASIAGLAGCSTLENEVLDAVPEESTESDPTPTRSMSTEPTGPQRAFSATFDDETGDWTGDTGGIEHTATAARGARAVRLSAEAREISLTIPETTVDRYSVWWRVPTAVTSVRITFAGGGGQVGFGAEIRTGTNGLEVVVNPETDGGSTSSLLSSTVRPKNWYKITFSGVDFDAERFDAALADVGDSELIRMTQSFQSSIDAVSTLTVGSRRGDAVLIDDVTISNDG